MGLAGSIGLPGTEGGTVSTLCMICLLTSDYNGCVVCISIGSTWCTGKPRPFWPTRSKGECP